MSDAYDGLGNPSQRSAAEDAILGIEHPSADQEKQEKERQQAERDLRNAQLAGLMDAEWFRHWLADTLDGWGTFDNIHASGPTGFPDALATQFHLGHKDAGWQLYLIFDTLAPDATAQMRREARHRREIAAGKQE